MPIGYKSWKKFASDKDSKQFGINGSTRKKECIFWGTIKKHLRVEQIDLWSGKYCSRQRYLVCVSWLICLNLTLGCPVFGNSADPENWVLFYEAVSLFATKINGCSQGNCSLSTFNKMFLSTFNFIPKINGFFIKNSSHFPFHKT